MFREATPYGVLRCSRREFVSTLLALPILGTTTQGAGFTVRGTLTVLDEATGQYAIGSEFALRTPPNSPVHPHLRALVGSAVRVTVDPT